MRFALFESPLLTALKATRHLLVFTLDLRCFWHLEYQRASLKLTQCGFPQTVVDALDCLNEWTATVTSLKTTEIGLYINKCRKDANASEKIKGKCKALLQKWKKDVDLSTSDAPNSSQHHGKAHHDDLKRRESAQIRKSQSNISVDTSQNGGDSREETPVVCGRFQSFTYRKARLIP